MITTALTIKAMDAVGIWSVLDGPDLTPFDADSIDAEADSADPPTEVAILILRPLEQRQAGKVMCESVVLFDSQGIVVVGSIVDAPDACDVPSVLI